ncbi:MAG: flagellar basal body L-ring protein FlgH [Phycisphaeraceae bacterium]
MRLTLTLTAALILSFPVNAQDVVPIEEPQGGTFLYGPAPVPIEETDSAQRSDGRKHLHQGVASVSFAAVEQPDIRRFQVNDLVMIIVRESFTNSAEQSIDTEKSVTTDAEISQLPDLRASDLLDLQMRMNSFGVQPGVNYDFEKTFEGEGSTSRTDTMAGRVMARVVDVKPNATLVLEARDEIHTDDETLSIIVSGTARAQDITTQNSIESDQLYGLHVRKEHSGELRKANKKGWITRTLDAVFDF